MRTSFMTTIFASVAAALLLATATPSQAQQYAGANERIGTIGDIASSKLRPGIRSIPGLNFSTLGLFADAEVYDYSMPSPFVFPMPVFGYSGWDFSHDNYEDYLNTVASAYDLADGQTYRDWFVAQNVYSMTNGLPLLSGFDDLSQKYTFYQTYGDMFFQYYYPDENPATLFRDLNYEAFDRLHQADFMAGGGFYPFVDKAIPEPIVTDPFVPFEGDPVIPTTLDAVQAEAASASQSASQAAAVVAVPEPATLGLMTLGATMLMTRSKKR